MQNKIYCWYIFRNKYSVIEAFILEIVYLGGILWQYIANQLNGQSLFSVSSIFISGALLIYEYRKYGSFVWTRAMILYSFVLFIMCLFLGNFTVAISGRSGSIHRTDNGTAAFSFYFRDFKRNCFSLKDPSTYLPALKQHAVLEPLFNVLLVLPFGVYLRYYFKCSF